MQRRRVCPRVRCRDDVACACVFVPQAVACIGGWNAPAGDGVGGGGGVRVGAAAAAAVLPAWSSWLCSAWWLAVCAATLNAEDAGCSNPAVSEDATIMNAERTSSIGERIAARAIAPPHVAASVSGYHQRAIAGCWGAQGRERQSKDAATVASLLRGELNQTSRPVHI